MFQSKKSSDREPSLCPGGHALNPENYGQRWDLAENVKPLISAEANTPGDISMHAKEAWRNSARCVGRALWKTLRVNDARHLETSDEVFDAIRTHLRQATNKGNIRSIMTVFREWNPDMPEIRIWNHQILRYAGYEAPDGTVLGDPMNRDLTQVAEALGWKPPREKSSFDLLPVIIQVGQKLSYYELSPADVLEVKIRHPEHPGIEQMGLKWYAVPIISDMIFATGSNAHGCAPFNGHYMLTEIATRNFGIPPLLPT